MRVLIVDDEQPARDRLRQLLEDEADIDVVGEAANGKDAIPACDSLSPDVVLLDIRMPGIDGIEVAHHLNRLNQPPAIIFATAYDEYAIDAFDAQAVGYVLKPVRRSRLQSALKNATRITASKIVEIAKQAGEQAARENICVQHRGELRLIPVSSITCFRADQKYVIVEHAGGTDLIDDPLKALADEFSDAFVRIHRSVLVAVRAVERIDRRDDGKQVVVLKEGSPVDSNTLIISRRHVADVRKRLKGT